MVFLQNNPRYSISRLSVLSVAHSLLKFLASEQNSRVLLIKPGESDFTFDDLCPDLVSNTPHDLPDLSQHNCYLTLATQESVSRVGENAALRCCFPCSVELGEIITENALSLPSVAILGMGDRFNVLCLAYKAAQDSPTDAKCYELSFVFDPGIVAKICTEIQSGLALTPETKQIFEQAIASWHPQPNLPEAQSEFTSMLVSALSTTQLQGESGRRGSGVQGRARILQPPIPNPQSTASQQQQWLQQEKLLHELLRLSWTTQGVQAILQGSAALIQENLGVSRCLMGFYSPKDERVIWGAIAHAPSIPVASRQNHYPDWAKVEQCLLQHHQSNPWAIERSPMDSYLEQNLSARAAKSAFLTWLHTHPNQNLEMQNLMPLGGTSVVVGLLVVEQWDEQRDWQPWERQLLHLTLHLMHRAHDLSNLYQQAEERITYTALLNRLVAQIRASLDVSHIFQTVTLELGHLLVADRCSIFQYVEAQQCWKPLVEYRAHCDVPTAMNLIIPDQNNPYSRALRNLQMVQVSDTRTVDDPINRSLAVKYPGAWLMVPIHRSGSIWGFLNFCQDKYPRYWHESELRFVTTVADQLAIAIYQATLYQKIQEQNQTLEVQVQERTAELESFFDAHPDYIFVVERQGMRLRFCNHAFAKAIGFDNRYSVQGRSIIECFPPLIANSFAKQNLRVFESGETLHEQETLIFADGTHHFDTFRVPLKHPNGEVYACLGTSRDITELLKTKQALAERTEQLQDALTAAHAASQAKTEFLATMSHELRTPLTSVIGMSSALMQPYFGELNVKQKEYLNIIHRSGQHLLQLINDILDVSKIEAGKASLSLSQFSLLAVGHECLALLQEKAQVQQVSLMEDFTGLPQGEEFCGDERRVKQILLNLLSNAVKFTPPGGEVWLRIGYIDDKVMIEVSDTGIGIPLDKQHLLFEAFQQIDSSLNRQHEGTGLGLALTRQLVEMHGGTIEFNSQEGVGTVFTVYLQAQNLD
ncbi:ATP-binding protein [Funiculus sociatus GB2-A5]|uniref:histidine kinase n=1 Tax=Funiculus sociatus GB2-A5 TaxID=2933946 RepID=A0ABV0JIY5_9CYAN|nr:ATP-binding protein [Trichocoleus sp. FACHB-6]